MKRMVIYLITILLLSIPFITDPPAGLAVEGYKTLMLFLVSILWWVTNVVPIMITGLFVIVASAILGLSSTDEIFKSFGNKAVFFLLGAFILSSALKRSGVISSIANRWISKKETERSLSLKIYVISIILSSIMVSHTVVAFLLPIVLYSESKVVMLSLLLGSVIGGNFTPLGGARGPLSIVLLKSLTGKDISFMSWIQHSWFITFSTSVAGFFLVRMLSDNTPINLNFMMVSNGSVYKKRVVMMVFVFTIIMWTAFSKVIDMAISALLAVLLLFIFRVVSWEDVEEDVNWGVILMYGGAIVLAKLLQNTGVVVWIAKGVSRYITPGSYLIILSLVALIVTETISNSASVAILSQVFIPLSQSIGVDPIATMFSIVIPSGFAMALPTGSPSVAMSLSTGMISVNDTVKISWKIWIVLLCSLWFSQVFLWGS